MERTEEEMREYLDWMHIPDPEQSAHYKEIYDTLFPDPPAKAPQPLSEEAKQAYIDEHLQVCAWCGETREWHNTHQVIDHNFDPNERVPT